MKRDFYLVEIISGSSDLGCLGILITALLGIVILLVGLIMDFAIFVFPMLGIRDPDQQLYGIILMAVIWVPAILLAFLGNMNARDHAFIICACPITLLLIVSVFVAQHPIFESILIICASLTSAWLPSGVARMIIRLRCEK